MKKMLLLLPVVVLLVFLALGVKAEGNDNPQKDAGEYYLELEDHYVEAIRTCLENEGIYNAGINVNCIIAPGGIRTYNISIHHDRIYDMTNDETTALLENLKSIDFPDTTCKTEFTVL